MFDSKDKKILELLQQDASLPVGDIANAVGISKSACWRRIHKFEENGIILSRVTLLDQSKVDLPLTVYISVRTNQHNDDWEKKFRKLVGEIPAITEVCRMSEDPNYLIKGVVKDMPGYDVLYRQLTSIELFDVSASFVLETIKKTTKLPIA